MSANKKIAVSFFLALFILSTLGPSFHAERPDVTQTDIGTLPNKQELILPIDTSVPEAKNQPIDIRIQFDQNCWAENETKHSIRVAYDDGSGLNEIESQIYDLSHTDESHIDACSLVFLIPEASDGNEAYYIVYSDSATESPSYINHITIFDTHYYYEPISGQKMDFDYYQINENGFIIYAICQKGELLGNGMSNAVIKLKPNSKEFKTTNAEQIAAFYMAYSIDPPGESTGVEWASDITKSILVQGNLMIRIQIKGTAPQGECMTDNIFSYYYCPNETKNLHVHCNHEILKDIQIQGDQEKEGIYASLSTIKARSATISDMNLGDILPSVHFYREDDIIIEYEMPTDPDADPAEWLLSYADDQDLGDRAWLCIDDPTTGKAHGLIFDKITGFVEGENDGIQLKTSVHQHVKLPGLEADSGDLFAIRNSYENGNHNTALTKGTNITFNVEYIALQTGGFEAVNTESMIYQTLIKDRPIDKANRTSDNPEEEKERYMLSTVVHFEPSFPLGSLLSAATGKNLSYLTAELYRENALASSGSIGRLQLGDVNIEFAENATFFEKIRTVTGIFDIKNSTLFKTIRFPDLEQGTYLIKIFKENPLLGSDRKYIGFSIVNVTESTKTHIFCKPEAHLQISVVDQQENAVANVCIFLQVDNVTISEQITDKNGSIILTAPIYSNKAYHLQTLYDGFIISESEVNLGFLHRWKTWTKTVEMELYSLQLTIKDTLGLAPAIDPNPTLSSRDMIDEQTITTTSKDPGTYRFPLLIPASYQLKLKYKSIEYSETISLTKDTGLEIVFPAEYTVNITVYNTVGSLIDTAIVTLDRQNKGPSEEMIVGNAKLVVPPGTYTMTVLSDEIIAQQKIDVKGDRNIEVVSNQASILHTTVPFILLIFGVGLFIFLWWKKQHHFGIHLLVIFLIAASLLQPWWQLTGDNGSVSTVTNTLLFPANIISLTTTSSNIGGEISAIPDELTMVLELIAYILIVAIFVTLISVLMKTRFPKISSIITIMAIVFLLLSSVLFYIAMSEVTKVGVGGFFGSGDLPISIPSETEQVTLRCTWGAGLGMYLSIIALLGVLIMPLLNILKRFKDKMKR